MEHINENTIKVSIAQSDLEARGITFFDLLGNQNRVESFFYSVLEEVGAKEEFEGTDTVTFQVVPKSDGLDLYISKGIEDSLEHIKASLGKVQQEEREPQEREQETPLKNMMKFLEVGYKEPAKEISKEEKANMAKLDAPDFQSFVFDCFQDYVAFAHQVQPSQVSEDNSLYHYKGRFYWGQRLNKPKYLEDVYYRGVEHGKLSPISYFVVLEQGRKLMAKNAVALTKKHF